MNKKGAIFHWVMFGLVAAIGLFYILTFDLSVATQTRGGWQLTTIRAFQEAEADLLAIDQTVKDAVNEIVTGFDITGDLGCGQYNGVALWNNKESFCQLKVDQKLKSKFNNLVKDKTKIPYQEIIISGNEISGKAEKMKTISSATEFIPTEEKSAGLFKSYQSFLIPPFHLEYKYNPGFIVEIGTTLGEYSALYDKARQLVNTCKNENELKKCLDENKGNWKYSVCQNSIYVEENRQVHFCVSGINIEYDFALDFSSNMALSVDKAEAETKADSYEISFEKDETADSYKVYYTDYLNLESKTGTADEVFTQVPTGLLYSWYFWQINKVDIINDCTSKEVGKAYICGDNILYVVDKNILSQEYGENYLFAVTTLKAGTESEIESFIKIG